MYEWLKSLCSQNNISYWTLYYVFVVIYCMNV